MEVISDWFLLRIATRNQSIHYRVNEQHVAGKQWSTRKYMNMDPLREMKLQYNGAAVA